MRAGVAGPSVRFLLLLLCAAVAAVIAWQVGRGSRGYHELRVYSHDGRWILKPRLVMPPFAGGKPDFESSGPVLIRIPRHLATEGREILVSGPGCGLLRTKFEGQGRITLPPPIRATIRVPGEFTLPSGDHGISLTLRLSGVAPEVATAAAVAPVEASHWDRPESPVWDERIWVDPKTRSVSVLLPCAGEWAVEWSHVEWPARSLGILFGRGESIVKIAADGEEHAVAIDPKELDKMGFGLGGD